MDGVLADFIGGICDHHQLSNPYANGEYLGKWAIDKHWGMTPSNFWRNVDDIFWANLNPTREAQWLVNFCINQVGIRDMCILTAPPEFEYAAAIKGKRYWLAKHFARGANFNMLFGTAKMFCAAPTHILIDDADHNVDAFREAGGKAILIPRPWNSLYDSKLTVMEHVTREWEKIHESEGDSGSIGTNGRDQGWLQSLLSLSR